MDDNLGPRRTRHNATGSAQRLDETPGSDRTELSTKESNNLSPSNVADSLLTKPKTAEFFAVSERFVDRRSKTGVLQPAAKTAIGGSFRFLGSELLVDLAQQRGIDQ